MKYRRQHKSLFCISILGPFYFLLLQCFSTVTASNYAANYNPTDTIALDCGSTGNSTASDGRAWTGDIGSILATLQPLDTTIAARAIRQGPVEGIPYLTARMSSSQFTYTFLVSAGLKFVRLYFYPSWYPGFDRSKALFSVKSGPFTLLSNFRADLVADSLGLEYFVREFCINVEENQLLNLTFSPSPSSSNDSYAFVNGIEIVSMPHNLYYTPAGDSGMFRFWSDDNQFFMGGGVSGQAPLVRNKSGITQVSDRQFIIYIDGEMVDEAADAIIWSGVKQHYRQSRRPNPEPPKTIFLTEPSQLTIKGSSNKKTTFIAVGVIVTVGLVLLSLRTMFRLQRESKDHGYKLKFTETKASLLPWEVCLQFSKAETKEVTHV
ncbi:Receptor-like protein kinase FERONIA [Vitis vinifera]|uniref:Receptor-like protein kinase FERONIA n=1 Tax=Vitis vinifera TaxID=29760 RepID=A0A438DV12_VITVI|nr:Receptor-like protein kinase FERONIA [Vitis vinifera]